MPWNGTRIPTAIIPRSLDELAPEYVTAIEPPTAGEGKWHYNVDADLSNFTLAFGTAHDSQYLDQGSRRFSSGDPTWRTDSISLPED